MIARFRAAPPWVKLAVMTMSVGGLFVLAMLGALIAFLVTAWFGQPAPVLGFEQTFEQPIDFPHTIHAGMVGMLVDANGDPLVDEDGEMLRGIGLDCLFCHRTVAEQSSAGIPPVALCSHCHSVIGDSDDPDLTTLRAAAGITGDNPQAINWRRVHRLPDHVRFAHAPHIAYLTANPSVIVNNSDPAINAAAEVQASSVCTTCHGEVAQQEQVYQVEALKMRQCVACHRENNAPTGCETCHY